MPIPLGLARRDSLAADAPPAALLTFLHRRGALFGMEGALCIVHWLTQEREAPAATAREVSALYRQCARPASLPPLRSAADSLRGAVKRGLLDEALGGGFRLTTVGRAVVLALPDRKAVGAARGFGRAARRPRGV